MKWELHVKQHTIKLVYILHFKYLKISSLPWFYIYTTDEKLQYKKIF